MALRTKSECVVAPKGSPTTRKATCTYGSDYYKQSINKHIVSLVAEKATSGTCSSGNKYRWRPPSLLPPRGSPQHPAPPGPCQPRSPFKIKYYSDARADVWCPPLYRRTSPTLPGQQSGWMCSAPRILSRIVEQSPVRGL